jgi:hypothetical protein
MVYGNDRSRPHADVAACATLEVVYDGCTTALGCDARWPGLGSTLVSVAAAWSRANRFADVIKRVILGGAPVVLRDSSYVRARQVTAPADDKGDAMSQNSVHLSARPRQQSRRSASGGERMLFRASDGGNPPVAGQGTAPPLPWLSGGPRWIWAPRAP